ncbi:hypothetical protein MATL_G00251850 [Megalops atlanticus]|uniref:Ferric-chelate reductase 1 n=1 Tax=Megalops atlanticus TaxID=7932 RepID=A0A9D3T006_MEGAT|nr:hypothetical protein MATL_G00251850 [Megalops atlanticus]
MDSRLTLVVSVVMGCLVLTVRGDGHLSNSTGSSDFTFLSVQPLTGVFNRTGCGVSKLCVEQPTECNPATNGTCAFVSSALSSVNGTDIAFELRGESTGYIALLLSPDSQQGNDKAYVCANSNNSVILTTALFNNSALTPDNTLPVSGALGSVSGNIIRCSFVASGLNATASSARSADTSFFVSFATGSFSNGVLGSPAVQLLSNRSLDLTNASSNASPSSAPTAPPTTAGGSALLHPALQGLVLLSMLILRLF